MKTIFMLAAAAATLASASGASARDARGHWEWRTRSAPGPRSSVPAQVRVWVREEGTAMADCNCAMMHASAADCMKAMPGTPRAPSGG